MRKLIILILCSAGCAGRLGVAPSTTEVQLSRCNSLDDKHMIWGGVAKGASVIAGGEGLMMLPLSDSDKTVKTVVASTALAAGALAAASVFISEDAASTWGRECQNK